MSVSDVACASLMAVEKPADLVVPEVRLGLHQVPRCNQTVGPEGVEGFRVLLWVLAVAGRKVECLLAQREQRLRPGLSVALARRGPVDEVVSR